MLRDRFGYFSTSELTNSSPPTAMMIPGNYLKYDSVKLLLIELDKNKPREERSIIAMKDKNQHVDHENDI